MKSWVFFALWVLLGVGVFYWGAVIGFQSRAFRNDAVVLEGAVSGLRTSDAGDVLTKRPVVKVVLPEQGAREFIARFSSSMSSYSIGQSVEVLWNPASGKVRLNSFGELFFPALFVMAVGIFILIGPIFCIAVLVWIRWPNMNRSGP